MEDKRNLIEIIKVLCDAVSDLPCGCEACPYYDENENEKCEVEELIERIER